MCCESSRNSFSFLLHIRQAFTLTVQDSVDGLKKEVSRLRKKNRILVVLSVIEVVLVSLIVFSPLLVPSVHATITHVVGQSGRGTGTSSIAVTMAATPTSGNVLVATIGFASYGVKTVSSITETGVTWTYQTSSPYDKGNGEDLEIEIWFGVVGAGASTSISIALSGSVYNAGVADVYEYSGVATTSFLDKTAAITGNSAASSTGTTATTTQANELWIGGVQTYGDLQSSPTNSFTLYDGAVSSSGCVGFLEKIVSSTGTANSGTTLSSSYYWTGCIATFKAASVATDYPPTYSTIGSNETIAGNVVNCYVLWVANSSNPSYFIFSTNNTGPWANQTAAAVSSNWGNYTFTLNATVGVPVGWKEWCNDTGGSWNSTAIQTITTTLYQSISVTTSTHTWTIAPGQNNVTINENSGKIALTVTSNAAFDIGAKASGDLTYGPYSIALTNTNMSASTWSSAIALTTSYQTVPGLSNVGSGTGLTENVYLWLSCPTNKPAGAYQETITFEIISHGGTY